MKRILIIPTAGLATRIAPVSNYFPKVLIPIGDEPVVAKILALYTRVQIDQVILVVSPGTEARYQSLIQSFSVTLPITLSVQVNHTGLLGALMATQSYIAAADQVCVHLSDTLLSKSFREEDFNESFVVVSEVSSSRDWCMVRMNAQGNLLEMVDKPLQFDSNLAIAGVYFFSNAALLGAVLAQLPDKTEMSSAIHHYLHRGVMKVLLRNDWSDLGDVRRFHALVEHFNTRKKVSVYRQKNVVVKKATTPQLVAEEYFYRHVRAPLCFPRLIASNPKKLQLSYHPARSLAYYALFEPMWATSSESILQSLWQVMNADFYHATVHWSEAKKQTQWMYGERIVESIEQEMSEFIALKQIKINGVIVSGWPGIRELILKRAKKLATSAVIRPVHGDLHFGNILYDPLSNTFLFLDPRGRWGKQLSIYGDVRYDMAKLLHSFHGGYEYLKRGLAYFRELAVGEYELKMPNDPWDTPKSFDQLLTTYAISLPDVLWIEALCFFSMCRCYADSHLRQQFFLQGLYLLNKLL